MTLVKYSVLPVVLAMLFSMAMSFLCYNVVLYRFFYYAYSITVGGCCAIRVKDAHLRYYNDYYSLFSKKRYCL